MRNKFDTDAIRCLYCDGDNSLPWAEENGYTAVKCIDCGLVYVNPRPSLSLISEAVKSGVHSELQHGRTVITRRVGSNVGLYRRIISKIFADVWESSKPISWLDVGAGYGEFIEAVSTLAPQDSVILGLEPMKPKADKAKSRGLNVREEYLSDINEKYEFVSLINVFSHIPDFRIFLRDLKGVLTDNGEVFIETGNIADLISHKEVPTELNLPDHLVFAGEQHIIGFLREAGFTVIHIFRRRKDGFLNFAKNIVKKTLGRKVTLEMPYSSQYRTLLIRAKLL